MSILEVLFYIWLFLLLAYDLVTFIKVIIGAFLLALNLCNNDDVEDYYDD